jgi:hypothetical protein
LEPGEGKVNRHDDDERLDSGKGAAADEG